MTRVRPVPEMVTVHVPFRFVKRGGRKVMVMPEGAPQQGPQVNNTMVKPLVRAFGGSGCGMGEAAMLVLQPDQSTLSTVLFGHFVPTESAALAA